MWNILACRGVYIRIERDDTMRDPNNDQLLARLQNGDDRALADLADTYGAKI